MHHAHVMNVYLQESDFVRGQIPDWTRVNNDICAGKPNFEPISVANVLIYVPLPQFTEISK